MVTAAFPTSTLRAGCPNTRDPLLRGITHRVHCSPPALTVKGNFYTSKSEPILKPSNRAWLLGMAQGTPSCSYPSSGAHRPSPPCSKLTTGEVECSSNTLQGKLASPGNREGVVEMKDDITLLSRRNQIWRQMSLASNQHMGRTWTSLPVPATAGPAGSPCSPVPAHQQLCKCPASTAAPCSCGSGSLPEQALQGEFGGGGERLLPVWEGSKIISCPDRLEETCLQMPALEQASLQSASLRFQIQVFWGCFYENAVPQISWKAVSALSGMEGDQGVPGGQGRANLFISFAKQLVTLTTPQRAFMMKCTMPTSPHIPTRGTLPQGPEMQNQFFSIFQKADTKYG